MLFELVKQDGILLKSFKNYRHLTCAIFISILKCKQNPSATPHVKLKDLLKCCKILNKEQRIEVLKKDSRRIILLQWEFLLSITSFNLWIFKNVFFSFTQTSYRLQCNYVKNRIIEVGKGLQDHLTQLCTHHQYCPLTPCP